MDTERELPLSPTQERLWFLDRLRPGDAAYNIYPAFRLHGPLAVDALERALTEIVRRHEPLRSRFPDRQGEPVQLVAPAAPVPLDHVDLSDLPAATRERRLAEVTTERSGAPFDLAAGPLLRVLLVRLGAEEHVLQLILHHVVGDGWSMTVLVRELAELYEAYRHGRPSPLPELPMQYGDHVLAERERLAGADSAEALAYWVEQLADPPVLDLPTDRPRPPVQTSAGGVVARWLPIELTRAVEDLARRQRCTLFMTLFAAYQVLLARHSGQRDILVGVPLAGRDRVELEPMIGYLTTTVVLRGDLSGNPTFATFLRRTRGAVLGAFANQDIPVEKLLGELGVERDLSRPALVQTAFAMQNQQTEPPAFDELVVQPYYADFQQAKFDLQLDAYRATNTLLAQFGYNVDLFDRVTVERLADRYERLLAAAVVAPDACVWDLPLLTDGERELLLDRAGSDPAAAGRTAASTVDGTAAATVPDLVAAQAAATPDAVAVWAGDGELTYAELLAAADRLAAVLRGHGVGRGSVVGVRLPRCRQLPVALLAAWRAGAGYLPLDPDLPADRLRALLADSGAALLVTAAGEPAPTGPVPVLAVDLAGGEAVPVGTAPGETRPSETAPGEARPSGTVPGDIAPPPPARPGDPAYVCYTSGSTGRPKGVLVEHGSLVDRVRWMRRNYALEPADRVLQFASIGFDTFAEELWPCLAAGGTAVLLTGRGALLPDFLGTAPGAAITVLDLPTAYWHELVGQVDRIPWPPGLRLVVLGGSEAHEAAVAGWRRRFGERVRLVNTYGPTEATIVATAADLGATDAAQRPPIGVPIGGARAYVLDDRLRLVPAGVAGELCLGGRGVARGYLGQPGATADGFRPDPYGPPGARLYRTGDRARWRTDGQLEFLGRLDEQVKVRGYRVEPGEVEARLREHPGVADAAVVADGDRLLGYVVPAGPAAADAPLGTELRAALTAVLPAYLVPAAFVLLDRLPLTRHGKLDRRALPAPGVPADAVADRPYRPPGTPAEELVAEVWAEVLERDAGTVSADDDFFALGGHSLLVTRVTARLRDAVGLAVPVRAVFTNPTLAGLAAAVEALLVAEIEQLTDAEVAHQLTNQS